jgi:putative CocE/NonD family hydrolase
LSIKTCAARFFRKASFEDVRPFISNKKSKNDIDEASDTYDTVDWLIKNIPNNNGRVGVYGISYPGFYATMAALAAHPAIKAVSPQAPVTDIFLGDDDHHNGALFLFESFTFQTFFGLPRPQPTPNQFRGFDMGTPDGYAFFLREGTLAHLRQKYFKDQNKFWNDVFNHGSYDEFWQARTPLPYLKNIQTAVLTVGGWFDAEDLYGPLHVYTAIEKNNPGAHNMLVMGPWCHGCWSRGPGDSFGNIRFEVKTGEWFREQIELPFFNFYLKDKGEFSQAEKGADVWAFRTGANEWKSFAEWPPKDAQAKAIYFQANGKLSFNTPSETKEAFDEYLSDPGKPVPYSNTIANDRFAGYMIEDQRFAATRPDVLVYATDALAEDLTLAGPIMADLFVSTTGTDADFIVKVIDVYPDNAPNNSPGGAQTKMGGFQMLLRGEVMRGKFRSSFSKPEPFTLNQPAEVKFTLQDVHHTFKAGHKLMVQVQSSWFPLVDRNPQKFVDIYLASPADFQRADTAPLPLRQATITFASRYFEMRDRMKVRTSAVLTRLLQAAASGWCADVNVRAGSRAGNWAANSQE